MPNVVLPLLAKFRRPRPTSAQVVLVRHIRLVVLSAPQAEEEPWAGDWSSASALWEEHTDVAEKFGVPTWADRTFVPTQPPTYDRKAQR